MDGVLHALLHIINTTDGNDTYCKIAVILVRNIERLRGMSITQISELCFVSPATLSRFFRDMGFASFTAFKEALGRRYGFEIDYTAEYRDLGKSVSVKLGQLRAQTLESLANMGEVLKQDDLEKLVRLLHDYEHIVFFGHTTYQLIVLYLQQRLSLFGRLIIANTHVMEQVDQARELEAGTLAVVVSPRGQSLVNNGVVGELYKHGVKTVLITQNQNPPFASRYHQVICMGGSPDNNLSMIALMHLVDQIVLLYYTRYHDELIV